jgi:hypothetical protein
MLQERPIVRVYFQEKDSLRRCRARSVKAKEVAFTKMMAKVIKAGQAEGVFRAGDPELIVNAMLGMLIWVHEWYRPERHAESDIGKIFWQLLSGGLLVRDRTKPRGNGLRRGSASSPARTKTSRLRNSAE